MNDIYFEFIMKSNGDTLDTVANAIGCCRATLVSNLNRTSKKGFSQRDIAILAKRWKLTGYQIEEMFFKGE